MGLLLPKEVVGYAEEILKSKWEDNLQCASSLEKVTLFVESITNVHLSREVFPIKISLERLLPTYTLSAHSHFDRVI